MLRKDGNAEKIQKLENFAGKTAFRGRRRESAEKAGRRESQRYESQ
jgi:hypothetical protein